MSKPMQGPNPPNEEKVTKISSARKMLVIILIVAIIIALVYGLRDETITESYIPEDNIVEPTFLKEGELAFIEENTTDTLAHIAIEVADDDEQRSQGLMYRRSMQDSTGMLFIFEEARPQNFWMKNTKIPLDIMYVSQDSVIFMIYKSVMPYSEKSIPSNDDALYVVEVNGGFSNRHQIEQGDRITFELMP